MRRARSLVPRPPSPLPAPSPPPPVLLVAPVHSDTRVFRARSRGSPAWLSLFIPRGDRMSWATRRNKTRYGRDPDPAAQTRRREPLPRQRRAFPRPRVGDPVVYLPCKCLLLLLLTRVAARFCPRHRLGTREGPSNIGRTRPFCSHSGSLASNEGAEHRIYHLGREPAPFSRQSARLAPPVYKCEPRWGPRSVPGINRGKDDDTFSRSSWTS